MLVFIGHLDLMRLFERAFKRSGLPLYYTQGFNPHLKISLPFPLSLGFIGLNEVGEIYLLQPIKPDKLLADVNQFLPAGIKLSSVSHLAGNISITNTLETYIYRIVFKDKTKEDLIIKSVNTVKMDTLKEKYNVNNEDVENFIREEIIIRI